MTGRRPGGQVAVYLLVVLVAVIALALMNVDVFLGVRAKNRATNAGDAHAVMFVRDGNEKLDIATDGFDVVISQYKKPWNPASAGIAVSRILLCKIVDEKAAWAKIPFPPKGLPRRPIFWREEMADGVTGDGGLCDSNDGLDWIEQKFRAMKIFGQNTYCKDLLEFGHNQGWNVNWKADNKLPGAKHRNWMWGGNGKDWDIWGRIVPMAVDQYGFDVLPYYEYGGAAGDVAHGRQRPHAGGQNRLLQLANTLVKILCFSHDLRSFGVA